MMLIVRNSDALQQSGMPGDSQRRDLVPLILWCD